VDVREAVTKVIIRGLTEYAEVLDYYENNLIVPKPLPYHSQTRSD